MLNFFILLGNKILFFCVKDPFLIHLLNNLNLYVFIFSVFYLFLDIFKQYIIFSLGIFIDEVPTLPSTKKIKAETVEGLGSEIREEKGKIPVERKYFKASVFVLGILVGVTLLFFCLHYWREGEGLGNDNTEVRTAHSFERNFEQTQSDTRTSFDSSFRRHFNTSVFTVERDLMLTESFNDSVSEDFNANFHTPWNCDTILLFTITIFIELNYMKIALEIDSADCSSSIDISPFIRYFDVQIDKLEEYCFIYKKETTLQNLLNIKKYN